MLLVCLRFKHHAPRDSEDGIKEYLLSDSLEKVVKYIDKEHLGDDLFDEENDYKSMACPNEDWLIANKHKLQEAKTLGLKVYKDSIKGLARVISVWYGGTDWESPSDLYYGYTSWNWRDVQEVDESTADKLVKLNVAKDLRDAERI